MFSIVEGRTLEASSGKRNTLQCSLIKVFVKSTEAYECTIFWTAKMFCI